MPTTPHLDVATWRVLRPWVRDLGARLLHSTKLAEPSRLSRDKLTIVTFHRVLPEAELAAYPIPGLAVTPEELAWLFELFRKHYTAGTLAQVATRFAYGERPEKPLLAITFDDGQRDNYLHAFPLLQAYGLHASFFVVSDAAEHDAMLWHDGIAYAVTSLLAHDPALARASLTRAGVPEDADNLPNAAVLAAKHMPAEQRQRWLEELQAQAGEPLRPAWDGMMRWHQLRELRDAGHEIGSHGRTHAILPLCTSLQLTDELEGSRRLLQEQLGTEIESFCYPNGDYDQRVVRAVQRAGYLRALTTRYGNNPSFVSPFTLKRIDMQGRHARSVRGAFSPGRVLVRLSGLLPGGM